MKADRAAVTLIHRQTHHKHANHLRIKRHRKFASIDRLELRLSRQTRHYVLRVILVRAHENASNLQFLHCDFSGKRSQLHSLDSENF